MTKVFISYSSKDRDVVNQIAKKLQELEHDVWYDQKMAGGVDWWDNILKSIRASDAFIFALSKNSEKSEPCYRELKYAYELKRKIIPVQIDTDIKYNLLDPIIGRLQIVNWDAPDFVKKINQALERTGVRELPDPLPSEPDAPFPPLAAINDEIKRSKRLSVKRQRELFAEIEDYLDQPKHRQDALFVLQALKEHPFTKKDIAAFADNLIAENNPVAISIVEAAVHKQQQIESPRKAFLNQYKSDINSYSHGRPIDQVLAYSDCLQKHLQPQELAELASVLLPEEIYIVSAIELALRFYENPQMVVDTAYLFQNQHPVLVKCLLRNTHPEIYYSESA